MPREEKRKRLTRRQLIGSTLAATGALAAGEAILPGFAANLDAATPAAPEDEGKVILF